MRNLAALFLILILLGSCELYQQDEYKQYYVIESFLVANNTLPQVRLSTSTPIDEKYEFSENTVSGADIEVQKLDSDSSFIERYPYIQQQSGIYFPSNNNIIVEDNQLYRLQVITDSGHEITATTYVPGDFNTVNELEPTYQYQGENQIELTTTPSSYITERQTYYVFTISSVNPDTSNLTPFYADIISDEDTDIEEYYTNSSGIINERNYDRNPDETITLNVPWIGIVFFGPNNIITNAIDDNLYDFLRSHDTQSGGTTLSPGEIQNIRYNVNGGIGIFGSVSSDTNGTFISRP